MMRFEDLVDRPVELMSHIYAWLGVSPLTIDPNRLVPITPQESDSHYSMKYLHIQRERLSKPQTHQIPPRIQAQIESEYPWFYQFFYPKHVLQPVSRAPSGARSS